MNNLLIAFFVSVSTLIGGSVFASELDANKPYPAFQFGVTGVWVRIEPGVVMVVDRVDEGTPAFEIVFAGDIVRSANGRRIEGDDPRVPLGRAITQAEASDGIVQLAITRDDRPMDVEIVIPALGAYGENWPSDCEKSQSIIEATAQRLVQNQGAEGWFDPQKRSGLTQCLAALFLLSTDDAAYDENTRAFAHALSANMLEHPSNSAWHLGYQIIYLAEYYLDTGDERVLPAMTDACRRAAEGQSAGSWGHSLGNVSVGYVQSGMMNSAGVTLFLGLTLARECGVEVSEDAFQRSLVFFYRMVGHGSICYGDHRAEIYADTNGRNAAIACAFAILDQEHYTQGAQQLSMMVADSYFGHEFGHTGGGFNVLWRGIVLPLVPDNQTHRTRRHMEQLAWYYDLCRLPNGGFSMLPSAPSGEKRYTGEAWGYGVGLTYTAPLRSLRITGKPRTQHSVQTPPLDELPWGNAGDAAFLGTAHAADYGEDSEMPDVTFARLSGRDNLSADYCAKMLRHYNPVFRTLAASQLAKLRSEEVYAAIETALQHDDPRVRRAACDAISGYTNWGRGNSGAGLPRDVVSERFVPHIEAILAGDDAGLWEIDGALWAMGAALPEDIRRNEVYIRRFAQHDEWYLRESAYWATVGLIGEMTDVEFLFLGEMFTHSRSVFERNSYDAGINFLLNRVRLDLEDETIAQYVQDLGASTHNIAIAVGYDEMAARYEAVHRIMMVLNRFDDPPYELIAADLVQYLSDWTPNNQHSGWLVAGSNWQPGLAQIATEMGRDGLPLMTALKQCDERTEWNENDQGNRDARDAIRRAVTSYETEFGPIRP